MFYEGTFLTLIKMGLESSPLSQKINESSSPDIWYVTGWLDAHLSEVPPLGHTDKLYLSDTMYLDRDMWLVPANGMWMEDIASGLMQRSANYSPQAKYGSPPIFVNKVVFVGLFVF